MTEPRAPIPRGEPNETIYVRNLEERIKIPELTTSLREIFGEVGTVVDIIAKTNLRARGQAFVVFEELESAADALEMLDGFEVFGKKMQLAYAKTKSDATVKAEGTPEEFEAHKRHRAAEKERKQALEQKRVDEEAAKTKLKRAAETDEPKTGLKKLAVGKGPKPGAVVPDEYLPPNKILFVQNLPSVEEYSLEALSAVFGRYDGFREVRLVPGRDGIAFVEYDTEQSAIGAKESTASMTLGQNALKVTYRRA